MEKGQTGNEKNKRDGNSYGFYEKPVGIQWEPMGLIVDTAKGRFSHQNLGIPLSNIEP